jgi:hypothetical protein
MRVFGITGWLRISPKFCYSTALALSIGCQSREKVSVKSCFTLGFYAGWPNSKSVIYFHEPGDLYKEVLSAVAKTAESNLSALKATRQLLAVF